MSRDLFDQVMDDLADVAAQLAGEQEMATVEMVLSLAALAERQAGEITRLASWCAEQDQRLARLEAQR